MTTSLWGKARSIIPSFFLPSCDGRSLSLLTSGLKGSNISVECITVSSLVNIFVYLASGHLDTDLD